MPDGQPPTKGLKPDTPKVAKRDTPRVAKRDTPRVAKRDTPRVAKRDTPRVAKRDRTVQGLLEQIHAADLSVDQVASLIELLVAYADALDLADRKLGIKKSIENGGSECSLTRGPRGGGKAWVEKKIIKGHDYLYLRWRDGVHIRSAYLGKPGQVD